MQLRVFNTFLHSFEKYCQYILIGLGKPIETCWGGGRSNRSTDSAHYTLCSTVLCGEIKLFFRPVRLRLPLAVSLFHLVFVAAPVILGALLCGVPEANEVVCQTIGSASDLNSLFVLGASHFIWNRELHTYTFFEISY